MGLNRDIIKILEDLKSEIQVNLDTNRINASGRTSSSFRVDVYDGGVRLVMGGDNTAPIQTLEIGRPGGRVPAGFTEILKQWSRDKNLNFASDSERTSFAYLLGKKIAREGTQRNKNHIDIYSSLVKEAVPKIEAEIIDVIKTNII